MKRGFLNSARYKRSIDEYAPACPSGPEPSRQGNPLSAEGATVDNCRSTTADGVCDGTKIGAEPAGAKSKSICMDEVMPSFDYQGSAKVSYIPPRPRPHRQGFGRHPDEDFFHRVPASYGRPRAKRAVFRLWPRAPDGKPMPGGKGTLSPDGYPWGATLYDIYRVCRAAQGPSVVAIMTGSALCEVMREMGEVDAAATEIEWAESEGKPRIEGVADTEQLIRCADMNYRLMDQTRNNFGFQDADGDQKMDEIETAFTSEMPVTSPFHPSHYPAWWPVTPFRDSHQVLLQERIPLHLLPQTLYIHDPFGLLGVEEQVFRDTSWTSRPDVIQTYNLSLSDTVSSQVGETRRDAEEVEEFKARTLIVLRYQRTEEQIKNHEPIIEVPLPPYLRRPTKTEESHLYLSPVARVGEGNHSIVYKGEWELPRNIFMKPRICQSCFEESVNKEVQRLKDTGRWEKLLKAAEWGPNGHTGRQPTKAALDAVNDRINPQENGEIIERELICVVPPDLSPSHIVDMVDRTDIWDMFMEEKEANIAQLSFVWSITKGVQDNGGSPVAILRVNPPFSYESQKSCTHEVLGRCGPVPRTTKFSIIAKLSLEHDDHLEREAINYQEFPERFFHHYNGYTIMSQLKTIVPVHAVVPQFYGYYTPEQGPSYRSPILLLEHCGEPIEPEKLSLEDQEECASLILRFQRAGWLHSSVAPRNFLVQYGKPTEFPLTRQDKPEPSFRLIDFGRSTKYETAEEKREEEIEVLKMFNKLSGRMAMTLRMG